MRGHVIVKCFFLTYAILPDSFTQNIKFKNGLFAILEYFKMDTFVL